MASLQQILCRRKSLESSKERLPRRLTTLDLTLLGTGATLGAGAYVLVGVIARNKTGPSIILSFLISGFVSILSALCYAEFGARVQTAGSAYVYSYVTVGEALAWTTGWQLLLEYIIGASSVARAWSGYVDFLAHGAISTWLNDTFGNWTVSGLAQYPDFLAVIMTLVLTVVCSVGVRESTMLNNVLTSVNVAVILFVIIAGSFFTHTENYSDFAPFGVSGIFQGAATAFFSYVGFDVIATSAEETINPRRSIPIAIILSLCICMACYVSVAAVITLMVNYKDINITAPLASAFQANNANWAQYIISVGAVCGLSTCLMTSIFPMPRIVYAISADGLLPKWLGRVHPWFNTPLNATMLCGALAAFLAMIFDLDALADMMSVGTLLSYTLVAASVLVLRYRNFDESITRSPPGSMSPVPEKETSSAPLIRSTDNAAKGVWFYRLLPDSSIAMWGRTWTSFAAASAHVAIFLLGCICVSSGIVVMQAHQLTSSQLGGLYVLIGVGCLTCLYSAIMLSILPSAIAAEASFTTPFAPYLPLLSIFANVYLLASLSPLTWVRFSVWCFIGTLIYVFYGMKHSIAPVEGLNGPLSLTAELGAARTTRAGSSGYAPVPPSEE